MVRGPVVVPEREAKFTRQVSAARARSAVVKFICTSFSASAKVAGDTFGPTAGPVPNAGGAPGGSGGGGLGGPCSVSCSPPPLGWRGPRKTRAGGGLHSAPPLQPEPPPGV